MNQLSPSQKRKLLQSFWLRVGLVAGALFAFSINPLTGFSQEPDDSQNEPTVHLYVVRRALDTAITPKVRELSHSAVLLESKSGNLHLLEFMGDGIAHLARVRPTTLKTENDHLVVAMLGQNGKGGRELFTWTRQKRGVRLDEAKSAKQLQDIMQSKMGEFSILKKEHCHTAQERLRDHLGVLEGVAIWDDDPFVMKRGQLTFDAEGHEGGRYHTRTPHVPSNSSGLTIGRGYDLKDRSVLRVTTDLGVAGLTDDQAGIYALAVQLKGDDARKYLADNKDKLIEITPEQQKRLFEVTYAQIEADVKRICQKADVVDAYGATDWENLNSKTKEVLIDLRFRGDYTSASRKFIQAHIANNDLEKFSAELKKKSNWPNVPKDRFTRRAACY